MEESSASAIRKTAEESFTSGLYCAESVVSALAKAHGIESELLPKMATAFCAGMSRTNGTCGAITGAIMGIGLMLGRSHPDEPVHPAYAATQKLIQEFEQEFGSRECSALLGCNRSTPEGQAIFRETGLRNRCTGFTGRAAEIAARVIEESGV